MSDHPINSLMDTSMRKIKEMIDVNSIIGDPITTPDGTVIIPVSKVTYGFASGGSDLPTKKENRDCFGGGSGAGVTIQPLGFLTISKGVTKFIPIEKYDGAADRIDFAAVCLCGFFERVIGTIAEGGDNRRGSRR